MQYSKYIGHESQLSGVEEYRLTGGKGDGIRLLQVRNGQGLECTVSPDRCADLSRVSFMGRNIGFFSPTGYVAPAYYEDVAANFLKSFTAGFLTTCGLTAAGSPCHDNGEDLPLHGTIGNTPAEHVWWHREKDALVIEAEIFDAQPFGRKYMLHRAIRVSTVENTITLTDTVENCGSTTEPIMILYHMNMGYPLLSEKAKLVIPSQSVAPRNDHAAKDIDTHLQILPPTAGFEEQCYYHSFQDEGKAKLYNPEIGIGLAITFDTKELSAFTQWKMMGEHDYVMGLEPGNCTPDGRDVMRREGKLQFLEPGQSKQFQFTVRFYNDEAAWEQA